MNFDPETDLEIRRGIAAPPRLVWRAWTEPDLLRRWFALKPWSIKQVTLDPRPGGAFDLTMLSPEGAEHPSRGCVLAVEPERRIAFTDALTAGWRTAAAPFMTALIDMLPNGGDRTDHIARVVHQNACARLRQNASTRLRHEAMGVREGWCACVDQLADLAATLGEPG